jgi:DNA-binding CsgD family transcriptional regulator
LSVDLQALHGRLAELTRLEAHLDRVASGSFQAVVVEGEAGIGKSRLLNAALELARGRGFHVLLGRGDEIERTRPFGPFLEALASAADAEGPEQAGVAAVLTSGSAATEMPLEPTRDPGLQYRVVDAFVDLVERLALAGPVVLALEDVHWADTSTLLTIRSLARRLKYVSVALLVTLRPLPRAPELERLVAVLAADGADQLLLAPLGEHAVVELVRELTGAEPAARLLEEVAGAAGNPLFVSELVQALADEGAIEVVDGWAEVREVSLPPSLRLTILRRLSFLSEATLDLLRVASVLGSAFSLRDLSDLLASPAARLLPSVREAIRAGVLEDRDARLRFRHDLIREAIYEDLPQNTRAALHLDAGRRLAAAGAPALQVAEQLALGARPGDAQAVEWLHEAAREEARRAPAVAAELLERALALTGGSSELRDRVLADLVTTLLWSGRPKEAEARAREALAVGPPPELEGIVRLGLVEALSAQGRHEDVIAEAERAVGDGALPAEIRSQLQAEAANALGFFDELEAAERAAREAVAIAPAGGDGATLGLLVLSDVHRVRGELDQSLEHASEALRLAGHRTGRRPRWPPEVFLGMALSGLDRYTEAHEALRAGREADERVGNVSYLPVYHYLSAAMLFGTAQWDDAVAQAESGLGLADEVGLGMLQSWPSELLARIAVHRGDLETAAAWLAAIEIGGGAERATPAHALLEEARGDTAGALLALGRAWDRDAARGVVYRRRAIGPDLVRLALAAGERERAEAVALGLEDAAALAAVPSLEGAALRCRGLLKGDLDLLMRAVEAYERGPSAFACATTREDAAAALARAGRIPEAKASFEQALAVYDEVGARYDTGRVLATMRELGIGRKRRGARKRPLSGWHSLTPSELEVVGLAAQGLTNPEIGRRLFISRRTVQTHLAHAFRKLDVSSRVELAAEAARRGGV